MTFDTIIVAPHPDDAALSLGGGLTASRFRNAAVIVVFSQTNFRVGGVCEPQVVSETRRREEFNALSPWVRALIFLEHEDHSLRRKEKEDASAVARHLCTVLDGMPSSSDTLLLFPMGVGGHPDHELLHILGRSLDRPFRKGYFEDLPYAAMGERHSLDRAGVPGLERSVVESDFKMKARLLRFYRSQGLGAYMDSIERHHVERGGEVIYRE